jgi:hypothetical protein
MSVHDYLTKDENILARCNKYYATEKRVIKYEKSLSGEKMDDLVYSHISSLSLSTHVRGGLIFLGIILLLIGLFSFDAASESASFLSLLGIVAIVCGIIFKKAYYQFRGSGISAGEEKKWRIYSPNTEEAKKFIKIVREKFIS